MFYIAVGEACRSKCVESPRNILNGKGIALRFGALGAAAHFIYVGSIAGPTTLRSKYERPA